MWGLLYLYTRIADYYYNNDNHGKISPIISRALTKYTHSNFKLRVFLVSSADSKLIIFMEQLVIDILQPEYNILLVAGSPVSWYIGQLSLTFAAALTPLVATYAAQKLLDS